jgi:hypothetical protein
VIESTRSLQQNSSDHLRTLQDFVPRALSRCRSYEEAFFIKIKGQSLLVIIFYFEFVGMMCFFCINKKDLVACLSDELKRAREHPGAAVGVAATAAFLLMPGIHFA